jgi:hypothetical protein
MTEGVGARESRAAERAGSGGRFEAPPPESGLLGLFENEERTAHAVNALRRAGFERMIAYSPIPPHEILEELDERPSVVRRFTLIGGIVGVICGYSIAAYSGVAYTLPLIVAGRPPIDWPPYVIIMFEMMVLIGGLSTFVGVLINARLPRADLRLEYRPEFTNDHFGVFVATSDLENARAVLMRNHALEIREVAG